MRVFFCSLSVRSSVSLKVSVSDVFLTRIFQRISTYLLLFAILEYNFSVVAAIYKMGWVLIFFFITWPLAWSSISRGLEIFIEVLGVPLITGCDTISKYYLEGKLSCNHSDNIYTFFSVLFFCPFTLVEGIFVHLE